MHTRSDMINDVFCFPGDLCIDLRQRSEIKSKDTASADAVWMSLRPDQNMTTVLSVSDPVAVVTVIVTAPGVPPNGL